MLQVLSLGKEHPEDTVLGWFLGSEVAKQGAASTEREVVSPAPASPWWHFLSHNDGCPGDRVASSHNG